MVINLDSDWKHTFSHSSVLLLALAHYNIAKKIQLENVLPNHLVSKEMSSINTKNWLTSNRYHK